MIEKIVDGRTDLIVDYLEAGHDADSTDSHGVSLIRRCAYYGDVSAIKYLISKGESLNSLGSNFDLNGACFHGHWQLVQFLIEEGADVNLPLRDNGETPLHNALCKANRPAYDLVIEVLLANGADPQVRTLKNAETGGFMRDARTKAETPLHRAAAFGTENAIDLLIEAGAERSAVDMNGDSPLSWASWHLRPGSVLKRLKFGDHHIGDLHVESYKGDHGSGFGGMELHLLGIPHHDD
ncbi:MAG: hypothetical protein HKN33_17735 [Pyrinomonadaceae bacterium]|nr:hypothetical protein [Pyrinomonadaceae bacterium]